MHGVHALELQAVLHLLGHARHLAARRHRLPVRLHVAAEDVGEEGVVAAGRLRRVGVDDLEEVDHRLRGGRQENKGSELVHGG